MSVYKIYKEGDEDNFYIGSTKDFQRRINSHKHTSKNYDCKLYNYINENGGWDCFKCEVLEYCLEYQQREKELIQTLKPSLNMRLYDFNEKETQQIYYEKNKEQINKKKKEWYEKNKDRIIKKQTEKITCECGSIVSKNNLPAHKKTKKHLNHIYS